MKLKRRGRNRTIQVLLYLLLTLCAVAMIFPVIFMICNSFLETAEIMKLYQPEHGTVLGFRLIPEKVSLIGYYETLLRTPGYLTMFWNSILLTIPIVAGQIAVSSLGGYAFGKLRFPFRNAFFFLFVIIMMMPIQVMIVPTYIITRMMGVLGTYPAVILPGIFSAFGVFLMRQFTKIIPDECLEAARLDGAGHWSVFTRIVLPQLKSGLASLAILGFIDNWNMVEQPLILLSNENQFPLSVFLSRINIEQINIAFVSGVLFMVPVILLYLLGENYLLEGIRTQAKGGIK